ncbi:MAG: RluA family pseudouridine synthase [Deltaproteobacteria bacterium]|nr:RluA family pseudouridine synthase [Deltaproteobacteria bacterium]
MAEFEYIVQEADEKQRLDIILTQALQSQDSYSRSKVGKFIDSGAVRVNEEVLLKAAYKPESGDVIYVSLPEVGGMALEADASVRLNIIYEDEQVLVINKDAGIIVHPGAAGEKGTLAHGLIAYLGERILVVGHPMRPGIVHRLDKDTSGLMVVAKTPQAYNHLSEQFLPPRTVKRTYLAFTLKLPFTGMKVQEHSGTISLPIMRHPQQRIKMTAQQGQGRAAITHWQVQKFFEQGFLLELQLETGRTHQIRAHLEALKAPIIGDALYGFALSDNLPLPFNNYLQKFNRVALHAWRLSFLQPQTKQICSFEAPLPAELNQLISLLS